jgi:hypothetical protein
VVEWTDVKERCSGFLGLEVETEALGRVGRSLPSRQGKLEG